MSTVPALRTTRQECPTCGSMRDVVDGSHLKEIRQSLSLSLRGMAKLLGISHAMVDDMEKGRRAVSARLQCRYAEVSSAQRVRQERW